MDDKKTQQSSTRFRSLSTFIQHHPYISLIIPSLIFISISVTHLLVNDKTLQTIFQVIVYISGIIIGAILLLIADNQRKADSSKINLIFLYGICPAVLLGFVYFSKIIGDASAVFGIAVQIALAIYAKTGKSKESDVQENLSNPSPKFIQENSSASIQNNLPISIQNNNNSPISIQNHITTNQNVTNIVDKRSERERATADACKMLASKDSTSRIFGVKMLVNLADSWLDDSDPTCKKDEGKCQDIIDILCAYIRSPFPLAEKIEEYEARKELEKLQKTESENLSEEESSRLQVLLKRFKDSDEHKNPNDIATDYAKFHEEQDVRRTIFAEMSKRSSTLTMDENNNIVKAKSGKWSHFQFDFSQAPIFYPLTNLKIEKGNFSSAKFYSDASFSWTIFIQTADFKSATFTQKADFKLAVFVQNADFMRATFTQTADFSGVSFNQGAIFSWATFTQTVDFRSVVFTQSTFFSWAVFTQTADFMRATFAQTADFMRASFAQTAKFKSATFTQTANFCGATFSSDVDFRWATFKRFEPTFTTKLRKAQFSIQTAQKDYKFSVHPDSKPIRLGKAELDGIKRQIPVGAVLFDPDSDRKSKPAK
ncbi:pentapeptide repeat-containing protein [Rothia mucilaginosa]|jgi:uncharacterized low-complexity protein|uniref:pentapeptide repeat-containing protein n=1 Tax=Rothia mucilaginosa TaxID=43675 RepID=UPI0028ECADDA|nr:pentapeptide repeat-containing protein [Rothia mucilaginosa]